jgi:hypothetical protein
MIIKKLFSHYTIKLEKEDWWYSSIYTLLELLKSTPKEYRRYDPVKKIWIVSNKHLDLLESVQHYTKEEDKEGTEALDLVLS